MSDEKLTSDDVRKLFGDKIPMEAVEVIWCSSPDKTVAEVRGELEALAKKMAGKRVDLVERLQSEAVNWSATCGDLFGEAATEIASLRERVRVLEGALKPFAVGLARLKGHGVNPPRDRRLLFYPPGSGTYLGITMAEIYDAADAFGPVNEPTEETT